MSIIKIMRYSLIRKMDISNGPGQRVSLFTQGCLKHCPGCFNSETWDLEGGKQYTRETEATILQLLDDPNVSGLSILGGEPLLEDNLDDLSQLICDVRIFVPNATIWLWTGLTMETMSEKQFLTASLCDVVIDGPFIQNLKDTTLFYAGSTNQRMWKRLPNGFFVQEEIPKG